MGWTASRIRHGFAAAAVGPLFSRPHPEREEAPPAAPSPFEADPSGIRRFARPTSSRPVFPVYHFWFEVDRAAVRRSHRRWFSCGEVQEPPPYSHILIVARSMPRFSRQDLVLARRVRRNRRRMSVSCPRRVRPPGARTRRGASSRSGRRQGKGRSAPREFSGQEEDLATCRRPAPVPAREGRAHPHPRMQGRSALVPAISTQMIL